MNKKVAVVTGGSRGIGRAIALRLAQDGFDLVINYRRRAEEAEAVRAEAEQLGVQCLAVQADVGVMEDCQRLFDATIEAYGQVDVLVNNAGITRDNLLMRMSEEDWDQVMATNAKSVFQMSKLFSKPMMKQRHGRMINIASVVGLMGNAGQTNYAASKAAVIAFTKSLAKELGGRGVLCNAVAPGFIRSDMTDQLSADVVERYEAMIPLKALGTVEAVAAAVSFLAGPDSAYITGQVLAVDGGMTM